MPKIDVIMPQMGESIVEGTLSRWIKKLGESVKRDEPIFEISTDKVDAEIPAPGAGVLSEILVQEGQTVAVQTVVARIETDVGAATAAPTSAPSGARGPSAAPAAPMPPPVPAPPRATSAVSDATGSPNAAAPAPSPPTTLPASAPTPPAPAPPLSARPAAPGPESEE